MKKSKAALTTKNRKLSPSRSNSSDRPNDGLVFSAIPTNHQITTLLKKGKLSPSLVWPGRTIFTAEMKRVLANKSREMWHSTSGEPRIGRKKWIVNNLADPDRYPHALKFLAEKTAGSETKIFNHPNAVLGTRRDKISETLSGIQHLTAPKCIRFRATHPNHFQDAFQRGGFEYPVLIRPSGSQTGQNLLFIGSKNEWDKIYSIPWGGCNLFMTQWVDFQSSDNEWRKLRLSITPSGVRLRHILFGSSWLIHSVERDEAMVQKEVGILKHAGEWEKLQQLGKSIREKVGLDFFGVDIGWKSDTEFVLFEANATMSILSYRLMPEFQRDVYVNNIKNIEKDVWQTLEATTGSTLR
ncbi:hypothetical protein [Pseudophaeobacter leonis]|uniref:hypothetical protein n=1 Tax=Pseudophaeobacter leonis TaxID=1144477 RepID=UPI00111C42CF|nr:hypothetical protein [Pseudophaeobacter leonis]